MAQGVRTGVHPSPPRSGLVLPWDDATAPDPVEGLRAARAELGDTFALTSGPDEYLFVFSDTGLASFYALAERQASKGLADYTMLLRKLPPELFEGRRTFAHDLFGAQNVETYLGRLDLALDAELAELGDHGTFEVFGLARRLGHRLGLACWIGPDAAVGKRFGSLMADLDQLDGAVAFVDPDLVAAVRRSDYAAERAALARIEAVVGEVLAAAEHTAEHTGEPEPGDFLGLIAARWADVDDIGERTVGIARDVVLLHVATMTNLVAAIGWALVAALLDPGVADAVRRGDRGAVDAATLEAIRLGQRSIMMRTVLRDLSFDAGDRQYTVGRGTIISTMVPVTNLEDPPRHVTTFGHGSHRCPAKRFSMSAVAATLAALMGSFDLVAGFDRPPPMLGRQIGGVGRAALPCPR